MSLSDIAVPGLPKAGVGQLLRVSQMGLPAVLTDALFKQIANLCYVKTSIGGYFFDAVFRVNHESHLVITKHPVQGGANVSDHCYMEPARVTMEIGMSDANPTTILGQFLGRSGSKSQSAFDALREMQSNRQTVDAYTRLASYKNMLVESINVPDDIKSATGLRASVTLQQIIVVDVPVIKVSARPAVTGNTNGANPVPVVPNQSLLKKGEGWLNDGKPFFSFPGLGK